MWRTSTIVVLGILAAAGARALAAQGRAGDANPPPPDRAARALERLAKAEIVFTATLATATEGPTALSEPPIRSYLLEFTGATALRGTVPAKVRGWYFVRSKNPPAFKEGAGCMVVARMVGEELRIEQLTPGPVLPADDDEVRPRLPRLPRPDGDDGRLNRGDF